MSQEIKRIEFEEEKARKAREATYAAVPLPFEVPKVVSDGHEAIMSNTNHLSDEEEIRKAETYSDLVSAKSKDKKAQNDFAVSAAILTSSREVKGV